MKKTLEKITNYAIRIAEPDQLILFGSMAQGAANVFSDVDLLIISENQAMKREVIAKIASFSNELSLKTDVLVYSTSEIEHELQKPNSFIGAIFNSGKIIYKKPIKNLEIEKK
jgi:predicted nucleotidyltransferase